MCLLRRKLYRVSLNDRYMQVFLSSLIIFSTFELFRDSLDMTWYRRYTMFSGFYDVLTLNQSSVLFSLSVLNVSCHLYQHILNTCQCEGCTATNKKTYRADCCTDCWPRTLIYNRLNKQASPTLTRCMEALQVFILLRCCLSVEIKLVGNWSTRRFLRLTLIRCMELTTGSQGV